MLDSTAVDRFARHGFLVDAVRQAQAAGNWDLAARLLCDHFLDLVLDGPAPVSPPVRRIEDLSQILNLLPDLQGHKGADSPPVTNESPSEIVLPEAALPEPLTGSETRVLRYLATTRLAGPEIARELSVSPNTVRTHMRHIYAKLGAHRRSEAVERACTLGLLAHSTRRPTRSLYQVPSHP